MLKGLFILLVSLFAMTTVSHAEAIDFPYYQAWVTTDGGTTVNDGWWTQSNECGHQYPPDDPEWNGYWSKDPWGGANTIRRLDNGALAELYWDYMYDDDTQTWSWELADADLLRVTATHVIYYGIYDFEASTAYLFTNPIRIPRTFESGQGVSFQASAGGATVQRNITLLRKDLIVPSISVPGDADLTDCAIFYYHFINPDEVEEGLETLAPGRGEVWNFWHETCGGGN